MKKLQIVFKATLKRYNFGELFIKKSKCFDNYPTEKELLEFLNEYNEKSIEYMTFETTMHVEKIYQVINFS